MGDRLASVTQPAKASKALGRMKLAPDERQVVTFRLTIYELAICGWRIRRTVAPVLQIGAARNAPATGTTDPVGSDRKVTH